MGVEPERMVDSRSWIGPMVVVVLVLAAAYLIAYPVISTRSTVSTSASTVNVASTSVSAGTAGSSGPYSVNLAYKDGIGFYLVDSSGVTLYIRDTDPGNGTSTCTGSCVVFWPLFYTRLGSLNLPSNLSASSFANVTRPDGKLQTSFHGYPLYYYAKDKAPGQVGGQDKNDFYACCSIPSASSSTNSTG